MQGTTQVPAGEFQSATSTTSTTTSQAQSVPGMSEYTDAKYGFSFWYPTALTVTASAEQDSTSFPGGAAVQTLSVGEDGDTKLIVVDSSNNSITDEQSGHASPINQTKYFYDGVSGKWMVTYPEGANTGGSGATTTADVSMTTIGGLPMLASGLRFDTTIIPLTPSRFVVVTDGGGSVFTHQLAATVAGAGSSIDASAQTTAVQAEAAAYAQQQ